MAVTSVWVAEDMELPSGYALGFYGDSGFGANVPISQFQGRTFVVNPTGAMEYFEANNCKLLASGSWSGVDGVSGVIIGQVGDGISLRNLPNYLATLNFRFEHTTPVRTTNAKLIVHNGFEIGVAPSGLTVYAAELIHPDTSQATVGSGDASWEQIGGSGVPLGLVDSPGVSGLYAGVLLYTGTRHDWYVAMSCIPTLPNDKTFGFTFQLEYI